LQLDHVLLSLCVVEPRICNRHIMMHYYFADIYFGFFMYEIHPPFSMMNFFCWLLFHVQRTVSLCQIFTILLQDDEKILESYAKSWTSGVLDKALQRDSMAFTLAKHHLSGFVFQSSDSGTMLRKKLVKSLIRCYAQKRHHEVVGRSCFFVCLVHGNSFHATVLSVC
jgi:hypothetical protein